MLKLKLILNDLAEHAYRDDPRLQNYKRFYVEYLKKQLKSKNGDYRCDTHHIRVFTEGRSDVQIMKTSIHELSHHIDYMQRGETNHDRYFYAVYRRLLYTALDMKIFNKNEYMGCLRDSTDDMKVRKMLQEYRPKDSGYKKGMKRVVVSHAFEIKDILKSRGFMYNSFNKTWEKEIEESGIPEEELVLRRLGAEYQYDDATKISFQRGV